MNLEEDPVTNLNESEDRNTVRENITGENTNCVALETLEENYFSSEGALKDRIKETIQTNRDLDIRIEQMIEKSDGLWKCYVCDRTGKNKGHIREHVEIHIEGISHTCHICNKRLSNRASLRNHINLIHSELLSCDLCGKSGMNKCAYYRHKQTHHKILPGTLS